MENQIEATLAVTAEKKLADVLSKTTSSHLTLDPERIARVVALLGEMEKADYLALRALWKERYRELSLRCRRTKPQRKGGTPEASRAITQCGYMRSEARQYMTVRHGLRQLAREHAARTRAPVAV